jgi:hypothetical protein
MMIRYLTVILFGIYVCLNISSLFCQENPGDKHINDGPYIFFEKGNLKASWIENDTLKEELIGKDNYSALKARFQTLPDFENLVSDKTERINHRQNFRNADSIGVVADIHGEFTAYIRLLKTMKIIDDDLNWQFGTGHLVILGDVFDRGSEVTETFWHIFRLEKQALEAGGMVHFILGNHEIMVLGGDISYVNHKYKLVAEISGTNYPDLFSENYILGKWLRTKPVMLSIDDILFSHAGISPEMVQRNMTIQRVNHTFIQHIVGNSATSVKEEEILRFLTSSKGPVWYRGYFQDEKLRQSGVDSILFYYGKQHIVVGHTSCEAITPMFNGKIIAVDAGMGTGLPGAMLFYKDGEFYQGTCSGGRIRILSEQ